MSQLVSYGLTVDLYVCFKVKSQDGWIFNDFHHFHPSLIAKAVDSL